jgi:hypothetical protein
VCDALGWLRRGGLFARPNRRYVVKKTLVGIRRKVRLRLGLGSLLLGGLDFTTGGLDARGLGIYIVTSWNLDFSKDNCVI